MNRKPTKNTRGANADEKRYHKWIKEECFVCAACARETSLIAHHCEGATFKHNKVLVGHWFVIGLCQECDDIVTHGSRKAFRGAYGPQCRLWRLQYIDYWEHVGDALCPKEVYDAIMDWGK